MTTYYDILNVPPQASDEDVRRAYHALALRWHPDRNAKNRAQAEETFRLIGQAYDMLRTGPQRLAYNRQLLRIAEQQAAQQQPQALAPALEPARRKSRFAAFMAGLLEIFWPFTFRKEISHG